MAECKAKLAAQKDHNAAQKKLLDDLENEKRRLELQILNLKEDLDIAYAFRILSKCYSREYYTDVIVHLFIMQIICCAAYMCRQ